MKRLLFITSIALLGVCLLATQTVLAVSLGTTQNQFTGSPGEMLTGVAFVGNTEDFPKTVNIEASNSFINENGAISFTTDDTPRGLYSWITFERTSAQADPGESIEFKYTINVPEDAAPGTYSGGLLGTSTSLDGESGVGVNARAASLIHVTIEGDYHEEVKLESFQLNDKKFLQGEIIFDLMLKNEGDVMVVPKGNIEIYNEEGEKVNGIYAITKKFEDQVVVVERKDELPININQSLIPPDESRTYSTAWENINVGNGKYTAKAAIYYGENGKEFNVELTFEVVENVKISEFKAEKSWNSALPVNFLTTLQNIGNQGINPTGYITINNIFGSQKKRIDFEDADLVLLPGIETSLKNTTWDEGFAFGVYTANLNLNYGDVEYKASSSFWVLAWWQAVITIVVLLLLIFLIHKGIKGYTNMKKKLEKIEHKDKEMKE